MDDGRIRQTFDEIRKVDPPDDLWDRIDKQITTLRKTSRSWKRKVTVLAISIATLVGVSFTPPVFAAISQAEVILVGSFNHVVTHIEELLPGHSVDISHVGKFNVQSTDSSSRKISLDMATKMSQYPIYTLPTFNADLLAVWVESMPSNSGKSKEYWFSFVYNTVSDGPIWVNERPVFTDSASNRSTVAKGLNYPGYYGNNTLVWKTPKTEITLSFLSPSTFHGLTTEQIKMRLVQLATQFRAAPLTSGVQ